MQFTTVATVAALAATVAAWPSNSSSVSVDYVTEVFTAYTTYCPASTEVTFNGVTYTATEVSHASEEALGIWVVIRPNIASQPKYLAQTGTHC
jgi:hypothetical protein